MVDRPIGRALRREVLEEGELLVAQLDVGDPPALPADRVRVRDEPGGIGRDRSRGEAAGDDRLG